MSAMLMESPVVEEVEEKEEEMAPRDEALVELTKAIKELQTAPKSNGEWKIDIMKFVTLIVTLAGAFFWVGSTVTESRITQGILIRQVEELKASIEKNEKLTKENQYDLKSKLDTTNSRIEELEKRRR